MRRVAIFQSLVNEDRHDGKPVVGLEQDIFRDKKSRRAVNESSRVINGGAEVAGRTRTILNAKGVISAMPFEPLMAYSECIAVAGWNNFASGSRSTFACSKIKPSSESATGRLHIVETHVNIVLDIVPVWRSDIRTCPG